MAEAPGAKSPAGRVFHSDGTLPTGDWIFVFGSNLKGRHGLGAAKVAHKNFGAQYGQGAGPTGRAYAIPTKALPTMDPKDVLPLSEIAESVQAFVEYARARPQERFFVTRVGCVLAGYSDEVIAPMFRAAPENCSLPEPWRKFL